MSMIPHTYSPGVSHHTPTPVSVEDSIAALKGALLQRIKRSAFIYRIDCGGCNGCEIEIFASITSIFDAERFGIKVVPSPRHADILLFTGAVTRAMRLPALRAFEGAPDPKICVSYGACGCSGGIFHDLYCVWGGSDKIVPIDVYIPGCPPSPQATIYGLAVALGLLNQKLAARHHEEGEDEHVALTLPGIPSDVRVALEREARRLAGYQQGRHISDRFLSYVNEGGMAALDTGIQQWLRDQDDPRLAEIVFRLKEVFVQHLAGGDAHA